MPEVWQMTCAQFVGPWPVQDPVDRQEEFMIERDSRFSVTEVAAMWRRSTLRRVESDPEFHVARVGGEDVVLLHYDDVCDEWDVCGGYVGSILWVEHNLRGRGLGAELVLAKADLLDGKMDPINYTSAGLAAHQSAHRLAVQRALRDGYRLTSAVVEDYPEFIPSPTLAPGLH